MSIFQGLAKSNDETESIQMYGKSTAQKVLLLRSDQDEWKRAAKIKGWHLLTYFSCGHQFNQSDSECLTMDYGFIDHAEETPANYHN